MMQSIQTPPTDQADDALQMMIERKTIGKVVLTMYEGCQTGYSSGSPALSKISE